MCMSHMLQCVGPSNTILIKYVGVQDSPKYPVFHEEIFVTHTSHCVLGLGVVVVKTILIESS